MSSPFMYQNIRRTLSTAAATAQNSTNAATAAAVPTPADLEQLIKQHDGMKAFGPETWEKLINIATQRMHAFQHLTEHNDRRPSSVDSARTAWYGQRVEPSRLHDAFRDMKQHSARDRYFRFLTLWQTAVEFRPTVPPRNRAMRLWLGGILALVMAMVSAGGITRLTRSGLSMTHWKFFGEKRPTNPEEWQQEFEIYKASPEWRLHNQDMTIDDFKFIYHMEYGHRSLGRVIGLAFVAPFIAFLATKSVSLREPFGKALCGALGLGGLQGLVGWWMVKSGLDEDMNQQKAKVSPYRLASHLCMAFSLIVFLTILQHRAKHGTIQVFLGQEEISKRAKNFMGMYLPRRLAHSLAALTFITAMSGAFVAGNDAGLVYNEFPKMGNGYIPDDLISPYIHPVWRNIFENPTTVQFIHRCFAVTTFTLSWVTALRCTFKANCPQKILFAALGTAFIATAQASLGWATLVNHVPIDLAACHQAGAMALLYSATRLLFYTNNPVLCVPNIDKSLQQNRSLFSELAVANSLSEERAAILDQLYKEQTTAGVAASQAQEAARKSAETLEMTRKAVPQELLHPNKAASIAATEASVIAAAQTASKMETASITAAAAAANAQREAATLAETAAAAVAAKKPIVTPSLNNTGVKKASGAFFAIAGLSLCANNWVQKRPNTSPFSQ